MAAANPYHISLFLSTARSVGTSSDPIQLETVAFLFLKLAHYADHSVPVILQSSEVQTVRRSHGMDEHPGQQTGGLDHSGTNSYRSHAYFSGASTSVLYTALDMAHSSAAWSLVSSWRHSLRTEKYKNPHYRLCCPSSPP